MREERDNALKTTETNDLYRGGRVLDFRIQKVKLLHSPPWQTIDETVIPKDHWWPPVSDEARSVRGKWVTYYPPGTELAKITLSIDWHAYEGDPTNPQIEWTIDTPTSEYHPGKHNGAIYVKGFFLPTNPIMFVSWKSAIYSPFIRDRDTGNGSVVGDNIFEKIHIDLTELLDSLANFLISGPFGDSSTAKTLPPLLKFRYENTGLWRHYEGKEGAQEAFKRAASFFSRAYNLNSAEHANAAHEEKVEPKALFASIRAITEMLQLYNPELLSDRHAEEWNYREAFGGVETPRSWALEDKKWADKIVDLFDLGFLSQWRKEQVQQEEYRKYLAMRNKSSERVG